jgi:flagellin
MTIRVSHERPTLSLPPGRIRSEEARTSAAANGVNTPERTQPASNQAAGKLADVGQLRATTALLDRASSVADSAVGATDALASLLERFRDAAGQEAPQFRNLGALVSQIVKTAAFDGVNLLDGSQPETGFRVPVAGEGAELSLSAFDLTPGRGVVTVTGEEDGAAALEAVETTLANLGSVRGRIDDDSKRVDAHRSFVSLLADAVGREGSSSMGVEGARLAALQVKQSLGAQGFSIANQGPQTVLSLFR